MSPQPLALSIGSYRSRRWRTSLQRAAAQAKYRSEVAQQNAKIADMQAENAKQIGGIEEERQRARASDDRDAARVVRREQRRRSDRYCCRSARRHGGLWLRRCGHDPIERAPRGGLRVDASNERSRAKSARYNGRIGALRNTADHGAQATGQFANYRALSNPRTWA